MIEPISIFIISRNRPLYLWASLDSLYKYTRFPHRFVFGDNGSDDPMVSNVIDGFRNRRMFSAQYLRERNDPDLLEVMLNAEAINIGRYLAFIESDVMVLPQDPCWLTNMVAIMERDDTLAMLGSTVDQTDFVNKESLRYPAGEFSAEQLEFLIKTKSSERAPIPSDVADPIATPGPWLNNPPGRLLLLRTSAMQSVFDFKVRHLTDASICKGLVAAGWQAAVTTAVRHRHLSLINLFDYPNYTLAERDWYFKQRPQQYRHEDPTLV